MLFFFPGKVSSLDLKGDLLVSCGLTQRMGRIYCESVIKVGPSAFSFNQLKVDLLSGIGKSILEEIPNGLASTADVQLCIKISRLF